MSDMQVGKDPSNIHQPTQNQSHNEPIEGTETEKAAVDAFPDGTAISTHVAESAIIRETIKVFDGMIETTSNVESTSQQSVAEVPETSEEQQSQNNSQDQDSSADGGSQEEVPVAPSVPQVIGKSEEDGLEQMTNQFQQVNIALQAANNRKMSRDSADFAASYLQNLSAGVQKNNAQLSARTTTIASYFFLGAAHSAGLSQMQDAKVQTILGYSAIFEEVLSDTNKMYGMLEKNLPPDQAALVTVAIQMLNAQELSLPTMNNEESEPTADNTTTSSSETYTSSHEIKMMLASFAAAVSDNQCKAAEYSSLAAEVSADVGNDSISLANQQLQDVIEAQEKMDRQKKGKTLFKMGGIKVCDDDVMKVSTYTLQAVAIVACIVAAPATGGTSLLMAGAMMASLGASAGGKGNFLGEKLTKALESAGLSTTQAQLVAGGIMIIGAAAAGGAAFSGMGSSMTAGVLSMGMMSVTSSPMIEGTSTAVGRACGMGDADIMYLSIGLSVGVAVASVSTSIYSAKLMAQSTAANVAQYTDEVANSTEDAAVAANKAVEAKALAEAAKHQATATSAASDSSATATQAVDEANAAASAAHKASLAADDASVQAQQRLAEAQKASDAFYKTTAGRLSRLSQNSALQNTSSTLNKIAVAASTAAGITQATYSTIQGFKMLELADHMQELGHMRANMTVMQQVALQQTRLAQQIGSEYESAVTSLSENQANCTQTQAKGMEALADALAKT